MEEPVKVNIIQRPPKVRFPQKKKLCGKHQFMKLRNTGGFIGFPIWACTNDGCEKKVFSM